MDSRLIYESSEVMRLKATWEKVGKSEWIYFGADDKINTDLVMMTIDRCFLNETLYIALTRKDSFQIGKKIIKSSITSLLGTNDFIIWDTNFNKVIEFNKIGVFRQGKINN